MYGSSGTETPPKSMSFRAKGVRKPSQLNYSSYTSAFAQPPPGEQEVRLSRRDEKKQYNGKEKKQKELFKTTSLFKPSFTASPKTALNEPHLLVQTISTCSGTRNKEDLCRGRWGRFAEAPGHFSQTLSCCPSSHWYGSIPCKLFLFRLRGAYRSRPP